MAKVIVGSGFVAQSPGAGGVFSVVLQYLLGLLCAEADLLLDLCASVRPPDLLAAVRRTAFLDLWQDGMSGVEAPFSTVSQWWGYPTTVYAGETYDGSKRTEFLRMLDLPALTGEPFELGLDLTAMGDGPDRQLLREKNWRVVDAHQVAGDFAAYRRYIHRARAEFSVAKPGYVKTCSGWFSDRSACYLAAGRPVLVQETGFGAVLPTGRGVLSFPTVEEAVQGVAAIRQHYPMHCRAAQEIAREYFAAEKVLGQLLTEAGV